jgi:hypothetical protein
MGGSGAGGARSSTSAANGGSSAANAPKTELALPPVDALFDYQLGGAYTPGDGVKIVSRDRTAAPAAGLYNICYINGFQAQQAENDFWLNDHPELVLRDSSGEPIIDKDWDEMFLDISTAAKREALAGIVGGWIAGCGKAGFDAVEIDNLDSYTRSGGQLKEQNAVDFVKLLADTAHKNGLAIAQKNSSELVRRRAEMGTDFVVAEECNRYRDHVLIIEYRREDFEAGCATYPGLSIILRDLNLVKKGESAYVFEGC